MAPAATSSIILSEELVSSFYGQIPSQYVRVEGGTSGVVKTWWISPLTPKHLIPTLSISLGPHYLVIDPRVVADLDTNCDPTTGPVMGNIQSRAITRASHDILGIVSMLLVIPAQMHG